MRDIMFLEIKVSYPLLSLYRFFILQQVTHEYTCIGPFL